METPLQAQPEKRPVDLAGIGERFICSRAGDMSCWITCAVIFLYILGHVIWAVVR
jgi:hypothetical protein